MAYSLAHQWQVGSRQQEPPAGFKPDKSRWDWNWLERWMFVRPWENRFLDINCKDGATLGEKCINEGKNSIRTQVKVPARKKLTVTNITTPKAGASQSDNFSPRHGDLSGTEGVTQVASSRPKTNVCLRAQNPMEEDIQTTRINSRSCSNPKECSVLPWMQAQKQMSLPNSTLKMLSGGYQTARSPSTVPSSGSANLQKKPRGCRHINGKEESSSSRSAH